MKAEERTKFKQKKRGSALFVTIMLSFVGLIIMAGLMSLWQRYTRLVSPIKTYSTLREAAAGGLQLIASYIENGNFDNMRYGECPPGTISLNGNCPGLQCCQVQLKFKLFGNNTLHTNTVNIVLLGSTYLVGSPLTGSPNNLIYGMNSTAVAELRDGSRLTAYIEATYLRVTHVR